MAKVTSARALTWIWLTPVELVLDRIFDRDDLALTVVQLVEPAYSVVVLPEPVGR